MASGNPSAQPAPLDQSTLTFPEGGLRPWLTVAAGFLINAIVFGNVHIWGIYQAFYLQYFRGELSGATLSIIGSIACALVYGFGPFVGKASTVYGSRMVMLCGACVLPLGLLSASFIKHAWQLFVTQGLLFGLGGSMVFIPSNPLLAQWFNARRALATGFAVSGVGVGGLLLAPLTEWVLSTYGLEWALRVNAIVAFVCLMLAVALASERKGFLKNGTSLLPDLSLLRRRDIQLLITMGLVYAFAYVVPYYFFPTYVISIGLSIRQAALLVSLMNGLNASGRIIIGRLADYSGRVNQLIGCCLVAALSCLVMWPFVTSFGTAMAFAAAYGFTAGVFWNLYPVVTAELVAPEELPNANGVLYFSITIGQLFGPAIAGCLFELHPWKHLSRYFVGEVYTGGVLLLACVFGVLLRLHLYCAARAKA